MAARALDLSEARLARPGARSSAHRPRGGLRMDLTAAAAPNLGRRCLHAALTDRVVEFIEQVAVTSVAEDDAMPAIYRAAKAPATPTPQTPGSWRRVPVRAQPSDPILDENRSPTANFNRVKASVFDRLVASSGTPLKADRTKFSGNFWDAMGLSRLSHCDIWRPQGDSNPCYRRERAMS
jgi:hypothetical protein